MPPLDLLRETLLEAVLVSAAAAAAVFFLLRKPGGPRFDALGSALGFGLGVLFGNHFREVLPFKPGTAAWEWLPAAALVALGVGVVVQLPKLPRWLGLVMQALAAATAAWCLTPLELAEEARWLRPAFVAVVLAEWLLLEQLARRTPGATMALLGAMAFGAAAFVLAQAGSLRMAEVGLLFMGALLGLALISAWLRTAGVALAPAVAVLLPGLILGGYHETFSGVPWKSFALIGTSPIVLSVSLLAPVPTASWRAMALRFALLAGWLLVAVWLAVEAEPIEWNEQATQAFWGERFAPRANF